MRKRLSSLDRHSTFECEYDRPDRYRQIFEAAKTGKVIPRGAGVSYAAASFSKNSRSIDLSLFNRILAFDQKQRWIDVEAGASLGKLFEFLTPFGLHLPVQPGHPQITIGGCIAANVHGKNQFTEGVFGPLVQKITLFHPDHGLITASASENSEVFDLTIGGFGLTGFILSARLTLAPLPGRAMKESRTRVGGLEEAFHRVDDLKSGCDMIYCWNDLSRTGPDAGRGYIVTGSYIPEAEEKRAVADYTPLDPSARRFRPSMFGDLMMPWINRLYFHRETWSGKPRTVPLFDFLFPMVGKEFYLDFFGDRGFLELQVLLPADGITEYVRDFLSLFRRHGRPVALTTIKPFRGERRLLHFNGTGFNFTIEVRNTARNLEFLGTLDDLNSRFGGITNIIKDSRLSADVAERQYAGYGEFRNRLHQYDPKRRFTSSISERLGL